MANKKVNKQKRSTKKVGRRSRSGAATASPPLQKRLVLNRWVVAQLGAPDFETLASWLRDPELEWAHEDGTSRFLGVLSEHLPRKGRLTRQRLREYDRNIFEHTERINVKRDKAIRWRYFQYLALLFVEIYLDRFFADEGGLLGGLNQAVADMNAALPDASPLTPYVESDLRRLAIWSATGSGKTLLLHVNYLQFLHYTRKANVRDMTDNIVLLTTNERLSEQHAKELKASGIQGELFSSDSGALFKKNRISILDVHKLRDEGKQKTVSVSQFEGNNLVFVDEGHRGTSGEEWRRMRGLLTEHGFAFEYSATFGQAVAGDASLTNDYAKAVLFDYSYRYFYGDGYGKDFRILNLAQDGSESMHRRYLTACLLGFYEQLRLYEDKTRVLKPFAIDRPLWVFVGRSVLSAKTKTEVSDVLQIVLFLASFVQQASKSISDIQRLMSGRSGLLTAERVDLFAEAFPYLVELDLEPSEIFNDILQVLFNAPGGGAFHVEELKGADGEISLRVGDNEPFGLINIGDAPTFSKLCNDHKPLTVDRRDVSGSMFSRLDDRASPIKMLIGSKKFTEGWNSWRVSSMGLLNLGRSEGSEIIQMFGRGVRLRGHGDSLKRSSALDGVERPKFIDLLETLSVFGVRADYMRKFEDYLRVEGVSAANQRFAIKIPVIANIPKKNLKTLRVVAKQPYEKDANRRPVVGKPDSKTSITLDYYPRLEMRASSEGKGGEKVDKRVHHLTADHMAFLDFDSMYLAVQRLKRERGLSTLSVTVEGLRELFSKKDWYEILIPRGELDMDKFDVVLRVQEIAETLAKKYAAKLAARDRGAWESENLAYVPISRTDPNVAELVAGYSVSVDAADTDCIEWLKKLVKSMQDGNTVESTFKGLKCMTFDQHLYQPLLAMAEEDDVRVAPVALNEGEATFVEDLRTYASMKDTILEGKQLYVLRNLSRGHGVKFPKAGNFHPDFIVWVLNGTKQHIIFADPKGLIHESPDSDKLQFYKTIKEHERRLSGDAPEVTLDSFIISNTRAKDVASRWDRTKKDLEAAHVLFQIDDSDSYIEKMFNAVLS